MSGGEQLGDDPVARNPSASPMVVLPFIVRERDVSAGTSALFPTKYDAVESLVTFHIAGHEFEPEEPDALLPRAPRHRHP